VILQKELSQRILIEKINYILGNPEIKKNMERAAGENAKPSAATSIVTDIIKTLEENA